MANNNNPTAPKADDQYKVILVGDAGVGKSCLILQYAEQVFTDRFISTIGVDFKFKQETVGTQKVNMQVWDTAGQETTRVITSSYYHGALGLVVVFDLTNEHSFSHLSTWLEDAASFADVHHIKVLIGNKTDLPADRVVVRERAEELARENGMLYFETSARDHASTVIPFQAIAHEIQTKIRKIVPKEETISLEAPPTDQHHEDSTICRCGN